jgi:HD superfamily phosphodiesterase
LRKYGFDEVIINTAEAHHYDVPLTSSIGWVVTAADAISA